VIFNERVRFIKVIDVCCLADATESANKIKSDGENIFILKVEVEIVASEDST